MDIWIWLKDNFMEIFSLVTGLVYVVLEVRQKDFMWILGMLTSAATVYVFFRQGLYASSALNVYYFVIAFWGLYQWRRDSRKLLESSAGNGEEDARGAEVHLGRLKPAAVWWSIAVMVGGTAALVYVMDILGDPMSLMDASVSMLSAIATWWLAKSYIGQWFLWIAADILTLAMCISQGLFFMSALYAAYTAFAVWGYFYWKGHGRHVA